MSPQYREDVGDIIKNLTKRIERLERSHLEAGIGIENLFEVDGEEGTVGFFGEESIQVATPVTLADVIALLQAYGLSS